MYSLKAALKGVKDILVCHYVCSMQGALQVVHLKFYFSNTGMLALMNNRLWVASGSDSHSKFGEAMSLASFNNFFSLRDFTKAVLFAVWHGIALARALEIQRCFVHKSELSFLDLVTLPNDTICESRDTES